MKKTSSIRKQRGEAVASHRGRRWIRSVPVLVLLFAVGTLVAGERPDLSGTWELNDALSDDFGERVRAAMDRADSPESGGMSGMGAGRGGGRRGGPGGRGPGAGARGGPRPDVGAVLARLEEGVETLTIAQDGQRIRVVYADDRERVLQADGKKHDREVPYGPVTTKAAWKGAGLVVDLTSEHGRKMTEIYELAPDAPQLYVTVKMKTRRGKISFRRVYDPAKLDGEAASADN